MSENNNDVDNIAPQSLITKYWKFACGVASTSYGIFSVSIHFDHIYSKYPVCGRLHYSEWSTFINMFQSGGLVTILFFLIVRKLRDMSASGASNAAYYTISCSIGLSTLSSLLTLSGHWGGVCVDALDVAISAPTWAEWLFTCPLLMFVAVSIDDRPMLSRNDILIIFSTFISILFGFFIVFKQPIGSACFWLSLSCIAYSTVFKLLHDAKVELRAKSRMTNCDSQELQRTIELLTKKLKLATIFAILMQIYIIIYILALAKVLDYNETRVAFQLCDLFIKGMFALVAMDTHLELLHPAVVALLGMMRTNEARRSFMKYIFHEVRVPLNSITMGVDFLSGSQRLNEEEKESLLMMHQASYFMSETLNEVLNLQKIEEGKLELDLKFFSVRDSINTVLTTFEAPLTERRITLEVQIKDDFPNLIMGDRSRLEHVVANFLSNAIKFSHADSIIVVKASSRQIFTALPRSLMEFKLSVIDSGLGISVQDQKRLFTSFMQVRPGELQQGRGSGIGLAICKQLVSLHGGSVHCESVVGEGSTFSFIIPVEFSGSFHYEARDLHFHRHDHHLKVGTVIPEDFSDVGVSTKLNQIAPMSQPPPAQEAGVRVLMQSISECKLSELADNARIASPKPGVSQDVSVTLPGFVLVVDDVSSNRKMLKLLLQKKGLRVEMAEDGHMAVTMVVSDPGRYSMVFMDNMMPIMTGVEAISVMRREGFNRLVIGLTGCAMEDDIAEYVDAGADLVLVKPLSNLALNDVLRHVGANGTASKTGMKLRKVGDHLVWVERT